MLDPLDDEGLDDEKNVQSDQDLEDDYDTAKNLLASVMRPSVPATPEYQYSGAPVRDPPARPSVPATSDYHYTGAPVRDPPARPAINQPVIPGAKPTIPVQLVKPSKPVQHVKPVKPIISHPDDDDEDAKSTSSDHSYQSIDGAMTKRVVFVDYHGSGGSEDDSSSKKVEPSPPPSPDVYAEDELDEDIVQMIFQTEGLVRIPSTLTNYSQMSLKISGTRMNERYTQRV